MSQIEVKHVPLDKIALGKNQARHRDIEKGLDDLMESMNKWGLLQPITVFFNKEENVYEVLAGQRRYRAAKKLNWPTIAAIVRSQPEDEIEAKALSLTENVSSNPMTREDIQDALDVLMDRYDDATKVANALGVKPSFVRDYLEYKTLPTFLRQAVDSGQLGDPKKRKKAVKIAVDAINALSYYEENTPEEKVLELAKILKNKTSPERKDLVNEAMKDPDRKIDVIQKKAESAPRKRNLNIISLSYDDYERLDRFRDKQQDDSIEETATDLIIDGLNKAGF